MKKCGIGYGCKGAPSLARITRRSSTLDHIAAHPARPLQLVILPGCIVSVGEDATVHTHTLPAAIAAQCGQAAEVSRGG